MALLEVHDLRTYFHTRNGIVRAVDRVSFTIEKGETLGIVGESGSGKSVTCYSLLRLLPEPPGRIESGKALFKNEDLLQAAPERIAAIRGKNITMIFQDPMTSLNPYLRVEEQVIEPLVIHEGTARGPARARAVDMLKEVGIHDAASRLSAYPHEFSGGMRQRVMIAMSLITEPDLLIADEPTTALDVTVQAQILELIKRAQQRMGMAVILISHDLGVVAGAAERILVMYAGRIVECGATADVFRAAQHPYTRALQKSIPALQKKGEPLYTIAGMPPDLSKPIQGCPFAPRCEFAREICVQNEVHLEDAAPGHATACLRVQRRELDLNSPVPQ